MPRSSSELTSQPGRRTGCASPGGGQRLPARRAAALRQAARQHYWLLRADPSRRHRGCEATSNARRGSRTRKSLPDAHTPNHAPRTHLFEGRARLLPERFWRGDRNARPTSHSAAETLRRWSHQKYRRDIGYTMAKNTAPEAAPAARAGRFCVPESDAGTPVFTGAVRGVLPRKAVLASVATAPGRAAPSH